MSENMSNGSTRPTISEATRAKWSGNPEAIAATLPLMLDLTIENITENVMKINSMCDNPRLRFLIMKLVKASHDYIRDVGLQFDEWEQAWQFLTRVRFLYPKPRFESKETNSDALSNRSARSPRTSVTNSSSCLTS